ncbi:DgyrCDS11850 [Dimorphilus gyrociliatus]|uniref:DgyrCDS11850 n=1 Tax=Dimorphilus gyrociliatus TaxID=2664684 RepID=A0A7I8W4P7_9ANNE|nr:DgyrCDS11850 [Dimorphilus gyrociliatus]
MSNKQNINEMIYYALRKYAINSDHLNLNNNSLDLISDGNQFWITPEMMSDAILDFYPINIRKLANKLNKKLEELVQDGTLNRHPHQQSYCFADPDLNCGITWRNLENELEII